MINRRDFTHLSVASIAAVALPLPALAEAWSGLPHSLTLYGDGIHCDADALSALINRPPSTTVWFHGMTKLAEQRDNDTLFISGTFLIKKPIHITKAFNGKTLSGPATILIKGGGEPFVWDTGVSMRIKKIELRS